jgi:hypothetical protein
MLVKEFRVGDSEGSSTLTVLVPAGLRRSRDDITALNIGGIEYRRVYLKEPDCKKRIPMVSGRSSDAACQSADRVAQASWHPWDIDDRIVIVEEF